MKGGGSVFDALEMAPQNLFFLFLLETERQCFELTSLVCMEKE